MTITGVIAYCLLLMYLAVERWLRKGSAARALKPEATDRGSSYLLWLTSLTTLIALLVAPVMNHNGLGNWTHHAVVYYVSWFGVLCMLCGLILRYLAATTLGEFYTRTLRICENHCVVNTGPYRFIRHPGYLGTLLLSAGAGLAFGNWIVFLMVTMPNLISKLYRIHTEEKMLHSALQASYAHYAEQTWRLIPFVY